jgi:hypothetical protein
MAGVCACPVSERVRLHHHLCRNLCVCADIPPPQKRQVAWIPELGLVTSSLDATIKTFDINRRVRALRVCCMTQPRGEASPQGSGRAVPCEQRAHPLNMRSTARCIMCSRRSPPH